jgi:tetratricopeptide (TPR) repeat protein
MTIDEFIKELKTAGEKALKDLKFDDAIAVYTMYIASLKADDWVDPKKIPDIASAYIGSGCARCLNTPPDYPGAIEDLSKALVLDKKNQNALYWRAYACCMNGQPDKTIEDCKTLAATAATNPGYDFKPMHELLGDIYRDKKNYGKAKEEYAQALPQFPAPCSALLLKEYREVCQKAKLEKDKEDK